MLVQAMLSKEGYRVLQAANGAEGVEVFGRERPDVVLLDVMMPVMDGFEACQKMRQHDRDDGTPIIMLTGADDLSAISQAFDSGATDFITKPINWPLLTQRVRYALRSGALLREVRQNRLREAAAQRIAKLAFWVWEPATQRLQFSEQASELLQASVPKICPLSELESLVHPDDRERARRAFESSALSGSRIDLELRLVTGADEQIIRLIGERGTEGRDLDHVFGAVQNITDTRRAEALVDYLAMHDELTGLGNRRLFSQHLRQALEEARRSADQAILMAWIDLHRFHRHNDELGEAAGNALLAQVGRRLQSLALSGEVARVGGDEFAVMLQAPSFEQALHRLEQVLESLDHPFKVAETETFISFSAGVACFPEHAADAETIIALAQEAQRQARQLGRRVVRSGELGSLVQRSDTLQLERALRRALESNQFHLVYQPQMELRSGRIVGAEALLRWQHPERGLVSPVEFIPILEDTGMIHAVGEWVLHEACRQARSWQLANVPMRVGVNLSARQFHDPKLIDQILTASQTAGVTTSLIELEITESLAMQDPETASTKLAQLRELGFHIAIDDFGIGHSSLEYLLRFPLDTIKIDRAFVTRITDSQADRAIVRAITAIAQTLGLTTIAEGIENLRQSDFLEALGVTEIQGYLIGRPMSADQLDQIRSSFIRPGRFT